MATRTDRACIRPYWVMLTEHRRGLAMGSGAGRVWDGLAPHGRAVAVCERNRALLVDRVGSKFVPDPLGESSPKPAAYIRMGNIERGLPFAIVHNCNYALPRWRGWISGVRRNRYRSGFRLNRSDREIEGHLRRSLP
jgi:hypothetical protein